MNSKYMNRFVLAYTIAKLKSKWHVHTEYLIIVNHWVPNDGYMR